ncbi:MAG: hypothetical protein KDC28_02255 [Saprospiraceae bacterium]|nr:hypothetical protein [Saprospiraceae bacterium]MCB9319776.1 hypothetical protein [Lewinellaceae bacterium]
MNQFIRAIHALDLIVVTELLKQPRWQKWEEKTGRNALHYLGDVRPKDDAEADNSIAMLNLLLRAGLDINSIHRIPDPNCEFPATPLWHAYAKGRNKKLYTQLILLGAKPDNCMYAIAWNDDVDAAELFTHHGAGVVPGVLPAACHWKRWNIAEWFLNHGANVAETDDQGNSVLHLTLRRNGPPDFVQKLLDAGADLHQKNQKNQAPAAFIEAYLRKNKPTKPI